jgi:hypothetical protein
MRTRSILTIVLGMGLLTLTTTDAARAQSSVGIYNDASGSTCSLTAPSSGPVEAYVVVRPGPGGTTGLQFAAPRPGCFAATYLTDVTPPGMLSIGNSQTGISIATGGCVATPVHVLTIQYFATGTTAACCAYPVVNDPAVSDILVVDCVFNEQVASGIVSTINADASCSCTGNSPPNVPDFPSPENGATNVSVFATLGWTASDIDNNLAEFDVYLGTDPTPPLLATVSEQSYSPGQLDELVTYYWRVVARDTGGLERSGPVWTFTTRPTNSPPQPPFGPDPFDGALTVPVNVTLQWHGTDIDGDTLVYDVYFGTEAAPPLVESNTGLTMYTPTGPLPFNTVYHWRVVARDYLGHETSGPVWTFTTKLENYPPGAPVSPFPANGAVGVSPLGLTLSWLANDVDGDSLTFDLYLGTASNPPLFASGFSTMNYALPDLTGGTRYYWRVVAHDQVSQTTGPVWRFDTVGLNLPPNVPSSPVPGDNTTASPPVYLQWFCSDPNGDFLRYDVYFGTSPTPPLFVSNITTRSVNAGLLTPSQQYYWKVIARDPYNAVTAGPTWTFTALANTPPATPSAPSPPDGAVSQAANSVLAWECSDAEGNPIAYDIYLGTTSPPPLAKANHTQKSYAPGVLAFESTYYWKIVARDSYGAETPGPEWSFSTGSNSPPNAPSNPIPAVGTTTTTYPTLYWSATDPDGQPLTYDVYFGTDPSPPLAASGLTARLYHPGSLQSTVVYYWRVVASDGEFATSGPTWYFTAGTGGWGNAQIGLYSDVSGTGCSLSDETIAVQNVYVYLRPGSGATGLQFAAPKPPCFTGYFLGDNVPPGLLAIGNSQDGISIALGACVTNPMNVLTIQYLGLGTTPPCCAYPVTPDPNVSNILVVDCNFTELVASGVDLIINEDVWCPCGPLVPVLISTFSAKASEAGVEVSWELSGDETAQRYSLLRRVGEAAFPQVVQEGAVAGTAGSYLDASVEPGTTYLYELLVRTADGNEFRSPVVTVTTKTVALSLGQNHPNPFNPTTVIPYTLPGGSATSRVRLVILDVSGRMVRTLVDEPQAGGLHEAVWDGRDDRGGPVSSGIYFCVLDANGQRNTRKMVLLK